MAGRAHSPASTAFRDAASCGVSSDETLAARAQARAACSNRVHFVKLVSRSHETNHRARKRQHFGFRDAEFVTSCFPWRGHEVFSFQADFALFSGRGQPKVSATGTSQRNGKSLTPLPQTVLSPGCDGQIPLSFQTSALVGYASAGTDGASKSGSSTPK